MKKIFLVGFSLLALTACEYVPLEEIEIISLNGDTVTFICPVISAHRSTLIRLIDHECRVIKIEKAEK